MIPLVLYVLSKIIYTLAFHSFRKTHADRPFQFKIIDHPFLLDFTLVYALV